jgi:hypothetical protein
MLMNFVFDMCDCTKKCAGIWSERDHHRNGRRVPMVFLDGVADLMKRSQLKLIRHQR